MYIQQLNLPPPQPVLRQDPETNLLDLMGVVADNRWLIAGVTALALLLGGAYAVLTAPVYEANALIQVEETKENTSTTASALGAAANLFEIRSPASAEMEILRSRLVVGQAVQSLHLDLSVWPKYIPFVGKWLARGATSPSEPGFLGMKGYVSGNESLKVESFVVPPKFETKRFLVRLSANGYDLISPDGETLANGQFGTPLAFTVGGQKGQMLVSAAVGNPGAEFNLVRSPQLAVIERLQRSLVIVEQGRQSGVILTSLTGNDPEIIAQTLNEIGSMYVRQNVARKVAEAEKMLAFLKTNLPQLRAKIEQSESRFNQFRNRNGSFDLTTESKVVLDQSIKLQTSLLDLQQKRSDLDARFGPQHPNIQTIDVQIRGLTNELNTINNRMKSFPAVEQDYLRMTRDMKVDTELYASLLNSSQQLQLVTAGKVGNVRIVDVAAVPQIPIRPLPMNITAIAGMLGLLTGLLLAFLRNSMRDGIRHPTDIEQRAGLRVFSTIPFSKVQARQLLRIGGKATGQHILAITSPDEPAIENLRSLRTSLQFAMADATSPIVLVTGPTAGTGKSFISSNFAAVLGAANKKVLLIDADLRKGHLHQYFGLEQGSGFSDVLSGNVKLEDALHRKIAPNVDFLAAGSIPPNPAELLMTGATQQLLQLASKYYDMVIVCSAPVLAVSDAAILAPMVGGVFLVAHAEVTSLGELHESGKRLSQNGAQVKGVIFNGLNLSKSRYSRGYAFNDHRYASNQY